MQSIGQCQRSQAASEPISLRARDEDIEQVNVAPCMCSLHCNFVTSRLQLLVRFFRTVCATGIYTHCHLTLLNHQSKKKFWDIVRHIYKCDSRGLRSRCSISCVNLNGSCDIFVRLKSVYGSRDLQRKLSCARLLFDYFRFIDSSSCMTLTRTHCVHRSVDAAQQDCFNPRTVHRPAPERPSGRLH